MSKKTANSLIAAFGVAFFLVGCDKAPQINCSQQIYEQLQDADKKAEMLKACPELSSSLLRSGSYSPSTGKSY